MQEDPFDTIRKFDAMRGGFGPSLAPIQRPEPVIPGLPGYEPGVVPTFARGVDASGSAPAASAAPGMKPGKVGPMKLVNWRGRQIDEGVMSYAEALAQRFPGLRLTSAYRSPERNARTPGAAKNSWHMKGRAVDFGGSARDMQQGAAWARANGAREVLVHNAGTGQHLHVAW